ncbi:MAG: hypothetical protein ANABAC_0812 [Anaerolineae bacterium]|nr:MAG: hypothetical protein ANABAC_0812 [Anaerolineae bacterium]
MKKDAAYWFWMVGWRVKVISGSENEVLLGMDAVVLPVRKFGSLFDRLSLM